MARQSIKVVSIKEVILGPTLFIFMYQLLVKILRVLIKHGVY